MDNLRGRVKFAYRQGSRSALLSKRRNWYGDEPPAGDPPPPPPAPKPDVKPLVIPPELQDEVNKLVGKARLEGKGTGESESMAKLLKSLGVEKLEDAQAAITERNKLRDSQLTETQRLEKERDDAKKEAEEAKALHAKEVLERNLDRRDSRITAALKDASNATRVLALMKVEKPELVEAVLKDGVVDEKALTALVAGAKGEFKEYFGTRGAGSPSNAGGRNSDPNSESDKAAREANLRKARRDI